jgi:hypothetical protein
MGKPLAVSMLIQYVATGGVTFCCCVCAMAGKAANANMAKPIGAFTSPSFGYKIAQPRAHQYTFSAQRVIRN